MIQIDFEVIKDSTLALSDPLRGTSAALEGGSYEDTAFCIQAQIGNMHVGKSIYFSIPEGLRT